MVPNNHRILAYDKRCMCNKQQLVCEAVALMVHFCNIRLGT